MTAFWTEPDFDDHEHVQLIRDRASGLTAIIALHSTHLGSGAGGTRYWHYPVADDAMRDALRLSRGMSYKNAMAGLPMGGGKAVILADKDGQKTQAMLEAFGDAVNKLGGRYVTAQDVGISEADMVTVSGCTDYVSGLPVTGKNYAGGDPGPFTAMGVYYGIKAAVRRQLGKDSMNNVHVAIQGTGSVGGGVARLLARDGARLTVADVDEDRASGLIRELGGETVSTDMIMEVECDVFSPNALGAILNDDGIGRLQAPIVAGGANNQLARQEHGVKLAARGILYAPDYVINAGGIISVAMEYLCKQQGQLSDINEVRKRIGMIPERLEKIWHVSAETGVSSGGVADAMAQKLIGR